MPLARTDRKHQGPGRDGFPWEPVDSRGTRRDSHLTRRTTRAGGETLRGVGEADRQRLGLKPVGTRVDNGGMWRTFNELRAAERLEPGTEPSGPSEAMKQATRLPDSITFNGVRYVRDDDSVASRAAP
jgi:hypothetical protein